MICLDFCLFYFVKINAWKFPTMGQPKKRGCPNAGISQMRLVNALLCLTKDQEVYILNNKNVILIFSHIRLYMI